ncbi:ketohydroxyglutarate aldolase [Methylobacterium terrae]|uniref:Ketohydroxyglutarate aldolase n=1 Tax=Methylobacterium terrae TaxID=2202827 RepID=A0A2U8WK53_9HYPH|nr:ketohydroxyglutarate aldolase [Methylobacterium terrae]AWN46537.1 ketohydroxyglutarate aldolase [Methylobacterium terrae]
MDEVKVSVSIPDSDRFESTVKAASRAGLKVRDKLDILGVATGSIKSSALAKLRDVPGVDSVEVQREVGIPTRVR